ncbi:MAG: lipopolysaccharide biosynthesis protein [Acidobacteriota bacterium]
MQETDSIATDPRTEDHGPVELPKTLHARIVSGSFILLVGSGVATATNFLYNVAVARFLGPTGYGTASAVYTLLVLISAATLSFQIVSAKIVAQQGSKEEKYAVYRNFHRASWVCGVVLAILLFLWRGPISSYLNLPTPVLVALLAVGTAFYVPLGSRRGYIQGICGFRALATNLVLEGVGRLGGSLLLIRLGMGVRGVIAANAAAVAIAYVAAVPLQRTQRIANPLLWQTAVRETLQAMVFFSGQVLINNCDIVLVKHFFLPTAAGLYAAVAMVGRVIFTFSQSVVNSMFPIVAGTRAEERRGFKVVATSGLLVVGIGAVIALTLRMAPAWIWARFFGSGFEIHGPYGLPYLLSMYAVTTILYCLSVVIITYEMSYKIANTSWVQLAFSGIVIAAICLFHSSLREVIWVQLILMICLFVIVAVPFVVSSLREGGPGRSAASSGLVRVLRPVAEDEVISEFLKSDFNSPAFQEYHHALRELVASPDLDDPVENTKRRALLFIRHLALWKELPADTQWFEVELRRADLERVRVFPRAQWRKLAQGNFSVTAVAEQMRRNRTAMDPLFSAKIEAIGERVSGDDSELGVVLLIGVNEHEPLTVLDGNHRLMAAMLESQGAVESLRFFCGLSPKMGACCWYNTNLMTLTRYAKNVLAHLVRDPEAELARLLETG